MDRDAAPLLASRDYSRLKALSRLWLDPDDPAGRVLAEKLGSCHVLPPDALPAPVAVLGAGLTFVIEGGVPETRVLVMPEDHTTSDRTLPVSTPLGAALLGSMAGQWVDVMERDGRRRGVRLLMVECPRPRLVKAQAMNAGEVR
jgi:regulator of nucleoside diphosphate kinase